MISNNSTYMISPSLNLESVGSSASSGLFELPALGDDTGLDGIVSVRVVG